MVLIAALNSRASLSSSAIVRRIVIEHDKALWRTACGESRPTKNYSFNGHTPLQRQTRILFHFFNHHIGMGLQDSR